MRIDISSVENYANMTPEEKVAFFEAYELPEVKDNKSEIDKLKAALSKANSECASWKNQLREKQSEQERAEAERAEREKAKDEELATLRRGKVIDEYAKKCMGLGYDESLAAECAEAMADGRFNDVFAIQSRFMEAKTKEIEAAALNKQPGLSAGAPPVSAADKAEENQYRKYFGLPPLK